MKLYYSDVFELPLPEKHRFPMAKYRLLRERVADSPLFNESDLIEAPSATDNQLCRVHQRGYVHRVVEGTLTKLEIRRIGFPWSAKMVERSRRSTGASIAAAASAFEDGISVNLAGGTHHAFAGSGQGYCVFNDVCVAARDLQSRGRCQQILVVDCDVHQGNGTASITQNDPSIFTFSIHCDKNYPFRKTASDLDIELPVGTEDDRYLQLLDVGLEECLKKSQPEFVFYVSGADPYEGDRLGLLALSKQGLSDRDDLVLSKCKEKGLPVAISMAGGYAPKIDDIVDIHFETIRIAREANNLFAK